MKNFKKKEKWILLCLIIIGFGGFIYLSSLENNSKKIPRAIINTSTKPVTKSTPTMVGTTNGSQSQKLYSGVDNCGMPYSNWTAEGIAKVNEACDNLQEKERQLKAAQSWPNYFGNNQPDIPVPQPSQADLSPYLPYTEFRGDFTTPKPLCQKVFKVSKFMCIQTPDCVCNY